jgi:NitT/TauT family transport system substrate-binding protein
MRITQSRRHFLTTLLLGAAARLLDPLEAFAAEGPPETATVRFAKIPGICNAPQYVAEELLRAEGFADARYVGLTAAGAPAVEAVARGDADFTVTFAAPLAIAIDDGEPITVLAGVHVGCFELFGSESVRSIADLKDKSVGVQGLGSSQHLFIAAMAAYVGLDPTKDIHWAINPTVKPTELYEWGAIDAFLGFPPEPQDLRARHIGHVVVNSAVDWPWSQYFCCMLAANRDYAHKYPVATKRVLRAILKAPISASANRPALRNGWSRAGSPRATTMPIRRSARCLRQMARVRCRGYDPVLCPAAARSADDQVEPAEDHRRRHRLALFERGQARAEDVNVKGKGGFQWQ